MVSCQKRSEKTPLRPCITAPGNRCGAGIPGLEDFAWWLPWMSEILYTGAEQSDIPAEISGAYIIFAGDGLYHLFKLEFGCFRKQIHSQIRFTGIASVRRWTCKATTSSWDSHPILSNVLQPNFYFEHPNQVWVCQTTCIPIEEHWILTIVKDLYSQNSILCLFRPY